MIYCANPGALKGCEVNEAPVLVWDSSSLIRKRKYTWRAIKVGPTWVGTDTHISNLLVELSLRRRLIPGLFQYDILKKEPKGESGIRLDFLLKDGKKRCYIEIKSAIIVQDRSVQFPDSKSPRTIKQLQELITEANNGHRAILFFLIQRGDVNEMRINKNCDPEFNYAFNRALVEGVEIIAVKHNITKAGFGFPTVIPVKY